MGATRKGLVFLQCFEAAQDVYNLCFGNYRQVVFLGPIAYTIRYEMSPH